jgi:hypothetical protein
LEELHSQGAGTETGLVTKDAAVTPACVDPAGWKSVPPMVTEFPLTFPAT